MPGTITLTGTAGPGNVLTAVVFNNITSVTIDFDKNLIHMIQGSVALPAISVAAGTVVTGTKAGTTWTLVIS